MKIPSMNDETFERLAIAEDSGPISVGGLMASLRAWERSAPTAGVFGTLVSLQRRALHLSVEKLAAAVHIGIDELLRIEDDATYQPDPAAVRRLAAALKLPASQLLVLSGNVGARNERIQKAALQFAARVHETESASGSILNPGTTAPRCFAWNFSMSRGISWLVSCTT